MAPRFTPSRIPLLNQRWVVLPQNLPAGLRIVDGARVIPGGSQYGARWNHVGRGFEYSLSFYDGFNHLPLLATTVAPTTAPAVLFQRFYPQMRMYGGDAALPLKPFTIKAEAGYFTSSTSRPTTTRSTSFNSKSSAASGCSSAATRVRRSPGAGRR